MGNKSKNRTNRLNPQDKPKPLAGQEYDVTQSLNKIRPYSKPTKRNNVGDGTYSDEEQELRGRRGYISSNSSRFESSTTGAPNWERYDRLEDRFTSFSDKNEKDHTALRIELEKKIEKSADETKQEIRDLRQSIDKKLSKQWYTWTIIALVAIVGIIWSLSYQEISKLPYQMNKVENRIDDLEKELQNNIQKPDTTVANKRVDSKKSAQ